METSDIVGIALNETEKAKLFRAHFEIRGSKILLFCDDDPVKGDYMEVDDVEFLEKNRVICDSYGSDWRTKVFLSNTAFRQFAMWWEVYGDCGVSDSETESDDNDYDTTEPMDIDNTVSDNETTTSRGWFSWLW